MQGRSTYLSYLNNTFYSVSFFLKMTLGKFSFLLFSLLVKKCQSCWIFLVTLLTWKLHRRYPCYSCLHMSFPSSYYALALIVSKNCRLISKRWLKKCRRRLKALKRLITNSWLQETMVQYLWASER